MKSIRTVLVSLAIGVAAIFLVGANDDVDKNVVVRDDCDPDDPSWNATGGCFRQKGDVTEAEFRMELFSPNSTSPVGHQAWRNDPPYLEIEGNESFIVRNQGGRVHTFTPVANFGGGRVPPLNGAMAPAPECLRPTDNLAPGDSAKIEGLSDGNHRYQCCIHPWMRALVKVHPPK